MAEKFKTYQEQVNAHIDWLSSEGLYVDTLNIGDGNHPIEETYRIDSPGRGEREYAYKTTVTHMDNGNIGLRTWCRGRNGLKEKFVSNSPKMGVGETLKAPPKMIISRPASELEEPTEVQKAAAKKAYGVWINASSTGVSGYLLSKNVGAYRIRFVVSPEYGLVAIVPMHDEYGNLWDVQYLNEIQNSNGSNKIFLKDGRVNGLFHVLVDPVNGEDIGISESYVTAAQCYELAGIPTICAFGSHNIPAVAKVFRKKYPLSRIIIFADNDRHRVGAGKDNTGIEYAKKAVTAVGLNAIIVAPDFGSRTPVKTESDWNDLVRVCGREAAYNQIIQKTIKKEASLLDEQLEPVHEVEQCEIHSNMVSQQTTLMARSTYKDPN
mgnify:CR=1 FL=1